MVEILLSFVLLVAAAILVLWPSLGAHDHTIDGLFLTLTGSMLSLMFLFNFIWQLRFQGAKEVTALRQVWQKFAHSISELLSKGGPDMKTIPPRMTIPLVMGTVLLLVLAFPSSLYAHDLSASQQKWVGSDSQHVFAIVVPNRISSRVLTRSRERSDRGLLLMDADVRLRAAAALIGNPAIEKPAENARVPLRMIVITASPLLEV